MGWLVGSPNVKNSHLARGIRPSTRSTRTPKPFREALRSPTFLHLRYLAQQSERLLWHGVFDFGLLLAEPLTWCSDTFQSPGRATRNCYKKMKEKMKNEKMKIRKIRKNQTNEKNDKHGKDNKIEKREKWKKWQGGGGSAPVYMLAPWLWGWLICQRGSPRGELSRVHIDAVR